jgi:hypothetical protein
MDQMPGEKIVGVWKVKSFEFETSSGEKFYRFGQDFHGLAMFTKDFR